jgi:uncharacterized membrane protein YesL
MGKMLEVFDWISVCARMNLVWLVGNAPLITVVFLYVHGASGILFLALHVLLIGAFFTLPLTIALFRATERLLHDKDTDKAGRRMIHESGAAAKNGLHMMPLAGLWSVWAIFQSGAASVMVQTALLVSLLFLLAYTVGFCMMEARESSGGYKLAFLLTFAKPGLSMSFAAVIFVAFYVSVNGYVFLALFFTASLTACVLYSLFEQVHRRYEKQEGFYDTALVAGRSRLSGISKKL